MILLPERYSYIEAYLTLRCNFNCSYCINDHTGVSRNRNELSAKEWCLGINNICTNGKPITLGGGEPTIHKEFYDIVNGLNDSVKIDLLSNGSFNVDEFMDKISPERFTITNEDMYKSIRFSYHPSITDPEKIVNKTKNLIDKGYNAGIFGINHPNNLIHNINMTEKCSKAGVFFFVRDFLGYYDDRLYGYYKYYSALNGNKKKCKCKTEEMLIDPSGNVYRCHRDLYDNSGEIGNILNMAFQITDEFIPCGNYGLCNPCDVKLKMSPDLLTSKCAVEIQL
jgi:hypothetical protein